MTGEKKEDELIDTMVTIEVRSTTIGVDEF
jgi:hypothetical protein